MAAVAKAVKFLIVTSCLILVMSAPLQAEISREVRNYLDLELLQEKTSSFIQKDGRDTIDLSNYIIDLSKLDSEFNRQFYQEINNTISQAGNPVNIDFDNSIIQGDFELNQLGIRTYLSEEAFSSLLTPEEKEKINQYYFLNDESRLTAIADVFRGSIYLNNTVFTGKVMGFNSFFLQPLIAVNATFQDNIDFNRTIFTKEIDFSKTIFAQGVNFSQSRFVSRVKFTQAQFKGITDFSNGQFEASIKFNKIIFEQAANFSHSVFLRIADFSQTIFSDRLLFAKSKFLDSILLVNSTLEKTVTFRDIYLNSLFNLQDAHILNRIDFSNAFFTPQATINVSGLAFDSTEAILIGQPGVIGKFINVNRLQGNETVLRNFIRNFRSLEQIADANYIEYQQQQLKAKQMSDRLFKTSWQKVFTWSWISLIPQWLGLSLLLLLGDYGTNINIIFTIGIITIAWFSLLFWIIDRYRPHISQPIKPTKYEIILMLSSYLTLTIVSTINIFIATKQPLMTLVMIALVLIPLPILTVGKIYQQGRYHQLLDRSYFVENGEFREFRLLLGRLPIIPRFPFFRDRFMPIIWDKGWSWLNYYNFSLNNIFKVGLIDIRLRDRHLPGLISTLVWYQWCLGVLYVVLLLWTLSRTIPGLNLLIYF